MYHLKTSFLSRHESRVSFPTKLILLAKLIRWNKRRVTLWLLYNAKNQCTKSLNDFHKTLFFRKVEILAAPLVASGSAYSTSSDVATRTNYNFPKNQINEALGRSFVHHRIKSIWYTSAICFVLFLSFCKQRWPVVWTRKWKTKVDFASRRWVKINIITYLLLKVSHNLEITPQVKKLKKINVQIWIFISSCRYRFRSTNV